jgi:hypothetical protein
VEPLDAVERAALRGLGAAALVPVARRGIQGFVALGRKSSGDDTRDRSGAARHGE